MALRKWIKNAVQPGKALGDERGKKYTIGEIFVKVTDPRYMSTKRLRF